MPHTHSPIIRTSDEDWTMVRVPEGVAPNTVDWAHMAVVVEGVSLGERGRALVDGAVLSSHEIVVAIVVHGEVNG